MALAIDVEIDLRNSSSDRIVLELVALVVFVAATIAARSVRAPIVRTEPGPDIVAADMPDQLVVESESVETVESESAKLWARIVAALSGWAPSGWAPSGVHRCSFGKVEPDKRDCLAVGPLHSLSHIEWPLDSHLSVRDCQFANRCLAETAAGNRTRCRFAPPEQFQPWGGHLFDTQFLERSIQRPRLPVLLSQSW